MKGLFALLLVCAFSSSLFAKEMDLTTPEGVKIILHEDNAWEYKKGLALEPPKEDKTVELGDGRIILLKADYSWGFTDKATLAAIVKITIDSVEAKGVGKHADVAVATKTATDKCYATLVERVKAGCNKKMTTAKLADCIKRVEKDEDKQENFVKGVGWTVDMTMKLDRGSINAVIACALDTTATAAAAAAPATAKK